MESWSYPSEAKGLLFSEEMDLRIDALSRSREVLEGWDFKHPSSYENGVVISDRQAVGGMEFMELGGLEAMRKPLPSDLSVGILSGEVGIGSDSCRRVASPTCIAASYSVCGEEESGSRLSSSVMESNSQDSSLIDLKLGRLADCVDAKHKKSSRERSVLSSVASSLPAKRARQASVYSQTPFCQVHGCNMDLSSSKDYHKRHKVCDAHSKTAKVIVNGIEQRFCQQCSRFHLLAEFDDGKRSCRKRLAGHNERRRKPQFNAHSGKPQKLLQSYQGNGLLGSSLPRKTSFVFPDILPGGILCPEKYMQGNCCRLAKLEEEPSYNPQLAMPVTSGQLLPRSFLHLHGMGKQYASGIPSSGTKDHTVFDTASIVQELSELSNSSCALSLLSAQSQNLTNHCAGIPMGNPHIIQHSHAHYSVSPNSDKPGGVSSLEKFAPNGFYSSGIHSMEVDQVGPMILSDAGNAVDFEVHSDGAFQGSGFLNTKYCLSPEQGPTVDLLQLSSHLQRVEQQKQRNSMLVKQENDDFCCF